MVLAFGSEVCVDTLRKTEPARRVVKNGDCDTSLGGNALDSHSSHNLILSHTHCTVPCLDIVLRHLSSCSISDVFVVAPLHNAYFYEFYQPPILTNYIFYRRYESVAWLSASLCPRTYLLNEDSSVQAPRALGDLWPVRLVFHDILCTSGTTRKYVRTQIHAFGCIRARIYRLFN
jgi:hypothetical protein